MMEFFVRGKVYVFKEASVYYKPWQSFFRGVLRGLKGEDFDSVAFVDIPKTQEEAEKLMNDMKVVWSDIEDYTIMEVVK